jgi:hypothetical protein
VGYTSYALGQAYLPASNVAAFGAYNYPATSMMAVPVAAFGTNMAFGTNSGGCNGGAGGGNMPATNLFLLGTNAGGGCTGGSGQGATDEQFRQLHQKLDRLERRLSGGTSSGGDLPPARSAPGSRSGDQSLVPSSDPVVEELTAMTRYWQDRTQPAPLARRNATRTEDESRAAGRRDAVVEELEAAARYWQDREHREDTTARTDRDRTLQASRGKLVRPADSSR